MATARKIVISPENRGNFHRGYHAEAASKASELLQSNLDSFHILFLGSRHNHIVHHILTAYALGASGQELQEAFDRNAHYQKPRFPIHEADVVAMSDNKALAGFLDKPDNYSSFLEFFQREIEAKGVEEVLVEHLLGGDDHANLMLTRAFAGIFHPILHLGYALEFEQPALVAEALAMSAIHQFDLAWLSKFLLESEKMAGGIGIPGQKSLRVLMEEMRADDRIRDAHLNGAEIERIKTTLPKVLDELVGYASQYSVSAEQSEQALADMYDLMPTTILTLPESLDKYKIDFILVHILNLQAMLPSLLHHRWLRRQHSLRLLEWQGRYDLIVYVSHGSPKVSAEDLQKCTVPESTWEDLFKYSTNHKTDDGHLSKLVRALAWAQVFLEPFQASQSLLMKHDLWLKLANLACYSIPESAKEPEDRWFYM